MRAPAQLPVTSPRRRYVTVGARQVHLREVGSGDPIVLVHASPLSSRSLVGLSRRLGERFRVLAVDTPGYGGSEPLALEHPEIPDYADALAETLTVLGLERCGVYGSHTGAQIALELARRHPGRITTAVLDGLRVVEDPERQDLLANSLPPFAPSIDGAHLAALWTRYRDQYLFFPWFRREDAARLDIDMPDAEHLHDDVMDLLRAGAGYGAVERAALRHLVEPAVADLRVPVSVVARDDDPVASHIDRLAALPPSVTTGHLPRDPERRALRIGDLLAEHATGVDAHAIPPATPPADARTGRVTREYCDTSYGQLLVRRVGAGGERALLMLHASPGSAEMIVPLATLLGRRRQVVTIDTLGNGDSDKPAWTGATIADYAPVVAEAVEALGLGEVDVYGTHTGALIAAELAIQRPDLVARAVLEGVLIHSDTERRNLLAHYTPTFTPRDDGTHLLSAWSALRDQTLFWPWFNRTREGIRRVEPVDAEQLHRWYVELMKSGETYPIAYRAAFSYPTRERLPELATPTLMLARRDDMLHASTLEAADLARDARARTAPDDDEGLAAMIADFLEPAAAR